MNYHPSGGKIFDITETGQGESVCAYTSMTCEGETILDSSLQEWTKNYQL